MPRNVELTVVRIAETFNTILGELWIHDLPWLYTLEPPRFSPAIGIPAAVDAGRYRLNLWGGKGGAEFAPELVNVEGRPIYAWRAGAMPYYGRGVMWVGETGELDFIGRSGVAFARLRRVLEHYEEIWVVYRDGPITLARGNHGRTEHITG